MQRFDRRETQHSSTPTPTSSADWDEHGCGWKLRAGPLTMRTEANSAPRPGDTVQVWLDPAGVHLFDGATELRL